MIEKDINEYISFLEKKAIKKLKNKKITAIKMPVSDWRLINQYCENGLVVETKSFNLKEGIMGEFWGRKIIVDKKIKNIKFLVN